MAPPLLVVAPDTPYRLGLVVTLRRWRAGASVQAAESAARARALARLQRPALIVQVVDREEAVLSLDRYPRTLALLRSASREAVQRVRLGGARGIFETTITPADLIAALERVEAGEFAIQHTLLHHLVGSAGSGDDQRWHFDRRHDPRQPMRALLSPRELAAVQLLARGYTSKQVAAVLGATPKAIDLLVERACRRLGASHRAQAVAIAVRQGLVI